MADAAISRHERLLIANAEIDGVAPLDIRCRDGRIVEIAPALPDRRRTASRRRGRCRHSRAERPSHPPLRARRRIAVSTLRAAGRARCRRTRNGPGGSPGGRLDPRRGLPRIRGRHAHPASARPALPRPPRSHPAPIGQDVVPELRGRTRARPRGTRWATVPRRRAAARTPRRRRGLPRHSRGYVPSARRLRRHRHHRRHPNQRPGHRSALRGPRACASA